MSFQSALSYVLQNEGGFVDNPKDPGGATNLGVTQRLLDKYHSQFPVGSTTTVPATVQELTKDNVGPVFKWAFWDFMKLDQVVEPFATCIMDTAVNIGPDFAVKAAQLAVGYSVTDGLIGPKTAASINASEFDKWLYDYLIEVAHHRAALCVQNSNLLGFLSGWLTRDLRMILLIEPV